MHACMYACMHACMHACMYVCMYVYIHTYMHACTIHTPKVLTKFREDRLKNATVSVPTHTHTHTHTYIRTYRHLGFRFSAIILSSINIFAPNLVQWWKISSPNGPSAQKSDFRKSKMADGSHLRFRFSAIISASINIFKPNLVVWWKSAAQGVPLLRNKIFENPRAPSWISILGHNFGLDQHYFAKFGTVIENL